MKKKFIIPEGFGGDPNQKREVVEMEVPLSRLSPKKYGPHLQRLEREKQANESMNVALIVVACLVVLVLVFIGLGHLGNYLSQFEMFQNAARETAKGSPVGQIEDGLWSTLGFVLLFGCFIGFVTMINDIFPNKSR